MWLHGDPLFLDNINITLVISGLIGRISARLLSKRPLW